MKRDILFLVTLCIFGLGILAYAEDEPLKEAARFVGDAVEATDAAHGMVIQRPYSPLQQDIQRIQKNLNYIQNRFENFPAKESLPQLNARLTKLNKDIASLQSRLEQEMRDIQSVMKKQIVPQYQLAVLEETVEAGDYAFASVWFTGIWEKVQGGKEIEKVMEKRETEDREGFRGRFRGTPALLSIEEGQQWMAKLQEAADKQKKNEPVDFPKDDFLGFIDDLEKVMLAK